MIEIENIVLNQSFSSRNEIFRFLSNFVVEKGFASNAEEVESALLDRESQGTTGMMDGFAIPHAKCGAINRPTIVYLSNTFDVEWESMDGSQIKYIIAMFIPLEKQGSEHLQILSKVARMLMKDDAKIQLKNAKDKNDILITFEKYIN